MRTSSVAAAITVLALVCASSLGAQNALSRRDAETMKQKVAVIAGFEGKPAAAPRRTMVTENEVNAYLAYESGGQLPTGVVSPIVSILGVGRVSARAVVDLDAVRMARTSTSIFDPRNFLRGHLPVMATGTLRTSKGSGQFELESASVGGVPIPKLFLQEIVSYYSKNPERPSGIAIEDMFDLPSGIREVQVERGQAIIIQ